MTEINQGLQDAINSIRKVDCCQTSDGEYFEDWSEAKAHEIWIWKNKHADDLLEKFRGLFDMCDLIQLSCAYEVLLGNCRGSESLLSLLLADLRAEEIK